MMRRLWTPSVVSNGSRRNRFVRDFAGPESEHPGTPESEAVQVSAVSDPSVNGSSEFPVEKTRIPAMISNEKVRTVGVISEVETQMIVFPFCQKNFTNYCFLEMVPTNGEIKIGNCCSIEQK